MKGNGDEEKDFRTKMRSEKIVMALSLNQNRKTESFYPALQYYLKQLMKWDLCFCKCSNCGKVFIATSRHHSLCSKACRVEKNRQNKRMFDARARENGYDIDYKNTCQRMTRLLMRS